MSVWLSIHQVVHAAEEFRLPLPTSRTILMCGAAAVPIAVLLHDTCESWMPKGLPIIRWFRRQWAQDPKKKPLHLTLLRNVVIFLWAAAMLHDNPDHSRRVAFDFVADRISSEAARKKLTTDITNSRRAAFETAQEVVETAGMNDTKVNHQMEAEIRRRYARENKRRSMLE
eukprot:PhM_4_TR9773/c0_g1_i1/m.99569